jgi:hypothetical protein
MWPRALDLPWFPRRPGRRSRFIQEKRGIADRQPDISRPPDESHPDNLWQTLSDVGEGQLDDEETETRPLAAAETYPLINRNLLTPPTTMRGWRDTVGGAPFAAGGNALPLHARRMPDRHYLKEPAVPLNLTVKKQPVHTADEAYPVIIQNLFLSPAAKIGLPGTTPELHRDTPAAAPSPPPDVGKIRAGSGAEVIPSHGEPAGSVVAPGVSPSYQMQKADLRQTRAAGNEREGITQPHLTHLGQTLSRLLKPVIPRVISQHRPVEAPPITGEGISEGHAVARQKVRHIEASENQKDDSRVTAPRVALPFIARMPGIEMTAQPAVKSDKLSMLARLKQPATRVPGNLLRASPAPGGSPVSDASKIPGPSVIPEKAEHFNELASDTVLPEVLSGSEGSEEVSGEISRQLPRSGQVRRQKPRAGLSVDLAGDKANARYQTEGMAGMKQSSDMLHPVTLEYGSIGQGFFRRRGDKTLPVRTSEITLSHRQTTIVPSSQLFKAEAKAPLAPGKNYARQPALELPLAASLEPKATFRSPPGEELLTAMYTTIPELAASRYPDMPELALAPVGATPVASSRIARAEEGGTEGGEHGGESVTAPDIDAIAHDVYGILKRRLMAERERALGVY